MEGTTTSGSPRSAEGSPPPEGILAPSIVEQIESHLKAREQRREELHEKARRLRRMAQSAMVHLHDRGTAGTGIEEMQETTRRLSEWIRREAWADESLAHDAFQESVEASLLSAVLAGRSLPGPADLSVEPELYLLGLGDLVGEMRRLILAQLHQGDLARADERLRQMEEMFRALMRFDTTRAIVQLKPKQDVARSLLERTRGEVTMAHLLARAHPSSPPGGDR